MQHLNWIREYIVEQRQCETHKYIHLHEIICLRNIVKITGEKTGFWDFRHFRAFVRPDNDGSHNIIIYRSILCTNNRDAGTRRFGVATGKPQLQMHKNVIVHYDEVNNQIMTMILNTYRAETKRTRMSIEGAHILYILFKSREHMEYFELEFKLQHCMMIKIKN